MFHLKPYVSVAYPPPTNSVAVTTGVTLPFIIHQNMHSLSFSFCFFNGKFFNLQLYTCRTLNNMTNLFITGIIELNASKLKTSSSLLAHKNVSL
jgi:hypothetical protein